MAFSGLIVGYFVNLNEWNGQAVCKENGYLDGGYFPDTKRYFCIDFECPLAYEWDTDCAKPTSYYYSLDEIKPNGIFIRVPNSNKLFAKPTSAWTFVIKERALS